MIEKGMSFGKTWILNTLVSKNRNYGTWLIIHIYFEALNGIRTTKTL